MRRSMTFTEASSLISTTAFDQRQPVRDMQRAARGPGLITRQGFLHACGQRWFLTGVCPCVREGQAAPHCPKCGGTGKA